MFAQTSRYDDLIAKTLSTPDQAPLTLSGSLHSELRYGENPHQKAKWFVSPEANGGLHEAEILNGKALSYNNILDLEAATSTVLEFADAAAVAVKHNNPCGVGLATSGPASAAVSRALLADPVSVFGGIVAVNREVDLTAAEEMAKIFLECIIAPSYTPEALARLQKKKDLRVLRWPRLAQRVAAANENEFRSISGGFLVQAADRTSDWSADWKVVTEAGATLTPAIKDDLLLAWKVCAHLKSNAIALAGEGKTLGLGMGQVNRVDAVEHAVQRYQKHHPDLSAPVLASDAFFSICGFSGSCSPSWGTLDHTARRIDPRRRGVETRARARSFNGVDRNPTLSSLKRTLPLASMCWGRRETKRIRASDQSECRHKQSHLVGEIRR